MESFVQLVMKQCQCMCIILYILYIAGCAWTNANAVINLKSIFNSVFPVTGYAFGIVVPAFVGGQVGLMLGSKNKVHTLYN